MTIVLALIGVAAAAIAADEARRYARRTRPYRGERTP